MISCHDDASKFEIFTLADSLIEPLKTTTVVADWTLEQIGPEIDEEAAKRLGITAFDARYFASCFKAFGEAAA